MKRAMTTAAAIVAMVSLPAFADLATVADEPGFVAIGEIAERNAGRTECVAYDDASRTCSALNVLVPMDEERLMAMSTLKLVDEPALFANVTETLSIRNGFGCSDYANAAVTVQSDVMAFEESERMGEELLTRLQGAGEVCIGYFQDGDGLVARTVTAGGEAVEGSSDVAVSFAEATPELRPAR